MEDLHPYAGFHYWNLLQVTGTCAKRDISNLFKKQALEQLSGMHMGEATYSGIPALPLTLAEVSTPYPSAPQP